MEEKEEEGGVKEAVLSAQVTSPLFQCGSTGADNNNDPHAQKYGPIDGSLERRSHVPSLPVPEHFTERLQTFADRFLSHRRKGGGGEGGGSGVEGGGRGRGGRRGELGFRV